ncbi:hypothetical protein AY601_4733 [Pedobacter cryoconitis]|uniref:Uncharacterized protein n=1 Tax=Pedobacter cryoconitis TaxID=188932 RepID=A0A127VJW8_9SPHI|nr:hypothetical protein [Pedobacter cryoconitis]AMQ01562.1 hypothetical protein AY601_4733 [Pedobacter cryoconitis]
MKVSLLSLLFLSLFIYSCQRQEKQQTSSAKKEHIASQEIKKTGADSVSKTTKVDYLNEIP